jgi:hypothetical protein
LRHRGNAGHYHEESYRQKQRGETSFGTRVPNHDCLLEKFACSGLIPSCHTFAHQFKDSIALSAFSVAVVNPKFRFISIDSNVQFHISCEFLARHHPNTAMLLADKERVAGRQRRSKPDPTKGIKGDATVNGRAALQFLPGFASGADWV